MKFHLRKPSIKKRIAARTSVKRALRHSLGLKAPRGAGWFTNPKKAAYNRVYNKTAINPTKGCGSKVALLFAAAYILALSIHHIILIME